MNVKKKNKNVKFNFICEEPNPLKINIETNFKISQILFFFIKN